MQLLLLTLGCLLSAFLSDPALRPKQLSFKAVLVHQAGLYWTHTHANCTIPTLQAVPMPAGVQARLRSKQHLLDTLVDRARDVNAFTRARVLQTWTHLAERKVIPLGHWICVTGIAVGE